MEARTDKAEPLYVSLADMTSTQLLLLLKEKHWQMHPNHDNIHVHILNKLGFPCTQTPISKLIARDCFLNALYIQSGYCLRNTTSH